MGWVVDERSTKDIRIARTENTYDVSSLPDLPRHCFVTFYQCAFLSLKDLDRFVMHNVNDISELPHILKGHKVDHKPPKSRRSKFYEGGEEIGASKVQLKLYGPKQATI
jgi:hypothetical protein